MKGGSRAGLACSSQGQELANEVSLVQVSSSPGACHAFAWLQVCRLQRGMLCGLPVAEQRNEATAVLLYAQRDDSFTDGHLKLQAALITLTWCRSLPALQHTSTRLQVNFWATCRTQEPEHACSKNVLSRSGYCDARTKPASLCSYSPVRCNTCTCNRRLWQAIVKPPLHQRSDFKKDASPLDRDEDHTSEVAVKSALQERMCKGP